MKQKQNPTLLIALVVLIFLGIVGFNFMSVMGKNGPPPPPQQEASPEAKAQAEKQLLESRKGKMGALAGSGAPAVASAPAQHLNDDKGSAMSRPSVELPGARPGPPGMPAPGPGGPPAKVDTRPKPNDSSTSSQWYQDESH